ATRRAAAAAADLPARVVLGFVDDELNRLLDLDTEREVTLGLLALGRGAPPPPPAPPAPPLGLTTLPLSAREVDYPAIRRAHAASSLTTAKKVGPWRGPLAPPAFTPPGGPTVPLAPRVATAEPLETVILRRGSARTFERAPRGLGALSTVLRGSTRGTRGACAAGPGA